MLAVSMPNWDTFSALVDTATKCLATALTRRRVPERPLPRARRVGHGLEGREGLRRDHEERLGRIQVTGGFHEVGAVDVRHEAEGHAAIAPVPERFVGHDRPEVGSSDADVDHVANALARVALPRAAAHPVGELGHLVEHRVDLGHDVHAVHDDRRPLRSAQGDVQDGTLLRDVDLLPRNMASIRDRRPHSSASRRSSVSVSSVTRFFE